MDFLVECRPRGPRRGRWFALRRQHEDYVKREAPARSWDISPTGIHCLDGNGPHHQWTVHSCALAQRASAQHRLVAPTSRRTLISTRVTQEVENPFARAARCHREADQRDPCLPSVRHPRFHDCRNALGSRDGSVLQDAASVGDLWAIPTSQSSGHSARSMLTKGRQRRDSVAVDGGKRDAPLYRHCLADYAHANPPTALTLVREASNESLSGARPVGE